MNSLVIEQPEKQVLGRLDPYSRSALNNAFFKSQVYLKGVHSVYVDVDPNEDDVYIKYETKKGPKIWAHRCLIEEMCIRSGCTVELVHIFFTHHYI